jgi:hypothetical protein
MGGESLREVEWDEDTATTSDGYGQVSGEDSDGTSKPPECGISLWVSGDVCSCQYPTPKMNITSGEGPLSASDVGPVGLRVSHSFRAFDHFSTSTTALRSIGVSTAQTNRL